MEKDIFVFACIDPHDGGKPLPGVVLKVEPLNFLFKILKVKPAQKVKPAKSDTQDHDEEEQNQNENIWSEDALKWLSRFVGSIFDLETGIVKIENYEHPFPILDVSGILCLKTKSADPSP